MSDTFQEMETEDLKIHVASCALRYKAMKDRMRRTELAIYLLLGLVIANTDFRLLQSLVNMFGKAPGVGQ